MTSRHRLCGFNGRQVKTIQAQLSYLIYLNGRLRARVEHPTLSAAIDLLTPNTTYVTRIEAIDGHGNRAVSTLNVTFTTLDESPPEWVENARLSLVSAGDHSIELAWEPAIDDVAVVRYEIRDQNESLCTSPCGRTLDCA